MGSFGEYIHGHHGEYKNLGYGNASDQDVKMFFRNGKVGDADSCNQMLVLGSGKKTSYMWSTFVSEKKGTDFSAGYEHVVYADGTLETLHDVRRLVDFPFMGSEECSDYMDNPEKFNESGRKAYVDSIQKENNKKVDIPKELLFELACYCINSIYVGEKRFLCVLVPADESDYQEYCRSVINQILEVIPAGLRSNFSIATNPSPDTEKEFGMIFKRDGGILPSKFVRMDGRFDGSFLKVLYSFEKEMKDFLWNCVYDSKWIEECYENMELGVNDPAILSDGHRYYLEYYKGSGLNKTEDEEGTEVSCDEQSIKLSVSTLGKHPKDSAVKELRDYYANASDGTKNKLALEIYNHIADVFREWREEGLQGGEPGGACNEIVLLEKTVSEIVKNAGLNIMDGTEDPLTISFDGCLTEFLPIWIKNDFRPAALKEILKISENIKRKKHKHEFLEKIYDILLNRFERSVLEKSIIEGFYSVLEETESVPEKLKSWYKTNMDEKKNQDSFDRMVKDTKTVDQYIYFLRKRGKLIARVPDGKKRFQDQFLERMGSRYIDFHLLLSAVSFTENESFENLAREKDSIWRLYVDILRIFYENRKIVICLKRRCDLIEVYPMVMLYGELVQAMEAENIFLVSNGKKRKFKIHVVKENLEMLIKLQKGYRIPAESKKDHNMDPEFINFMRDTGTLPLEVYRRGRGIVKFFPDFIRDLLFSIKKTEIVAVFCAAVLLFFTVSVYLLVWNPVHQKKDSREEEIQALAWQASKAEEAELETDAEEIDSIKESDEPDDSIKKLIKIASGLWDKEEYRDASGIFETMEISNLIYTIENSDDSSNIKPVYEYLTLYLLRNSQDDSLISVDFYNVEDTEGVEELVKTSSVVIIWNYITDAEDGTRIYYYDKENDDYINFIPDDSCSSDDLVTSFKIDENLLQTIETEKIKGVLKIVTEKKDSDTDFQNILPQKQIFRFIHNS